MEGGRNFRVLFHYFFFNAYGTLIGISYIAQSQSVTFLNQNKLTTLLIHVSVIRTYSILPASECYKLQADLITLLLT